MTQEQYCIAQLDDEVNMGHLEDVERLLAQGADVNGTNVLGDTPLMAAAYTGQVNMVRLLLAWGADKSLQGFVGKTARELANQVGHQEVLVALDK